MVHVLQNLVNSSCCFAEDGKKEMYKDNARAEPLFLLGDVLVAFPVVFCVIRSPLSRQRAPGKRGHIVADTNVFLFARARNICCGHKFCVPDTKNVSYFVQGPGKRGRIVADTLLPMMFLGCAN